MGRTLACGRRAASPAPRLRGPGRLIKGGVPLGQGSPLLNSGLNLPLAGCGSMKARQLRVLRSARSGSSGSRGSRSSFGGWRWGTGWTRRRRRVGIIPSFKGFARAGAPALCPVGAGAPAPVEVARGPVTSSHLGAGCPRWGRDGDAWQLSQGIFSNPGSPALHGRVTG